MCSLSSPIPEFLISQSNVTALLLMQSLYISPGHALLSPSLKLLSPSKFSSNIGFLNISTPGEMIVLLWSHSILHVSKFFLCLSPYVLGWLSTSVLDSTRWWPDICMATWVLSNNELLLINTNHLHLFIVFTSFQGALISIVCLILKIVLEGGIISVLLMKNQAHRVELPKNTHSNITIPNKVTYAFILCQQLHS